MTVVVAKIEVEVEAEADAEMIDYWYRWINHPPIQRMRISSADVRPPSNHLIVEYVGCQNMMNRSIHSYDECLEENIKDKNASSHSLSIYMCNLCFSYRRRYYYDYNAKSSTQLIIDCVVRIVHVCMIHLFEVSDCWIYIHMIDNRSSRNT
jgi:hypothetical protein